MEAKLYAGVSERLIRLEHMPGVRLAILSGRPVNELSRLLPQEWNAELWGSHGRERLRFNGCYETFPPNPVQSRYVGEF